MREFKALVDEHRHRVYSFAYYWLKDPSEAEDVTQEALVKLWQNHAKIEQERTLPWLLRVTRNLCHDLFRSRRSSRQVLSFEPEADAAARIQDGGPDPSEIAESADFQRRVEAALRNIDDPYRTILILREIEDLQYEQIAETLQMPLNTVKVYLHRGRKMLREQLQEVAQP